MMPAASTWRAAVICGLAVIISAIPQGLAAKDMRVIDGDTLVLGSETFRLEGIDAPEVAQTCHDQTGKPYRCGEDSRAFLRATIGSSEVTCTGSQTDGYGRKLGTCYAGATNLNRLMVEQGHAYAFVRYSQRYLPEQAMARQGGKGVWSGTSVAPWDYRKERWQVSEQTAPGGCPIKGNISDRGRIYHSPWSPHYARTRINEAAGERWFCSEGEALAAGWRPPRG